MYTAVNDKAEFTKKLEEAGENKLVVVDFFALWCGPCKAIEPVFKELSETYTDVMFLKIDVDVNEDVTQEYNISSMPTFLFIKNKEKVDELLGANQEKLRELVAKHK